ncbi:MAG: peptidoglycan DD-metalloendopeptidase family protein [Aeromicrobium sp.]|uniref:peptidoglycan DD-metalloendopeptidase family protein n=1 Tax=Aeromicrobium sp. TaxID=1871063 RepID=UPI00262F7CAD|nr:peptidoglycan DD-metalloendopeptidase family protein [Aeromicrobium sp.]MDF1705839.1 peptidoglycan DD-metalloendopeptidase family protein [Aeromicrobium sp.]
MTGTYRVTSTFGMRLHPTQNVHKMHAGIDLVATGSTTIVAAAAGTVTEAGWRGGYGNQVLIDHGNGVHTRYGHLAHPPTVTIGQSVQAGAPIGIQGATGDVSGAHLHFEVRQNGQAIDPEPWMATHGVVLDGRQPVETVGAPPPAVDDASAGIGFPLPAPSTPVRHSSSTPAAPIPENMRQLYIAAAEKYVMPWTVLAAIGMIETRHGALTSISSAGAQGPMQFMPATFATYGIDGDGDGLADINSPADSVYSAANYLTASGISNGEQGVRDAIFAYNRADWYVNDVLTYAHAYGGGTVMGGVENCGDGSGNGDPNLSPLAGQRATTVLTWANAQAGKPYIFGGTGPTGFDCSGLVQTAFKQIGITMPRTAGAQRNWLAQGNGFRVEPGQERPGDLIFWDSYLGPNQVGHVVIVNDPATRTTIDARSTRSGVGNFPYSSEGKHIYEIWRVGNVDAPAV